MRLYSAKIPTVAADLVKHLAQASHIEVASQDEVELDVSAVLKEYMRVEREITDKAKDYMEARKLPYSDLGKLKRKFAEERDFGFGDEALNWIATQLLETFMHSNNVDEVYADDATLRREIKTVLKKHMQIDDQLDAEVRQRIKNLEEGTSSWEVEYSKVMQQIKQKHGIEE